MLLIVYEHQYPHGTVKHKMYAIGFRLYDGNLFLKHLRYIYFPPVSAYTSPIIS